MNTMIIAEAGSCHDGEYHKAMALMDLAKECGATHIKYQYWTSAARLAQRRHSGPDYERIYRQYQMPRDWLPALRARADAMGIGLACTVYLPEDVWFIAEHCDVIKVASFEANEPILLGALRAPYAAGKLLIISLGMGALLDPIYDHLTRGIQWSGPRPNLRLLHCVSSYPAPPSEIGLSALRATGAVNYHGFSDHCAPEFTWTGALAVAAGAEIIEKHIRLDDTDDENPDAAHAMAQTAFREYVRHIEFAETLLGPDTLPRPRPCEAPMLAYRVQETPIC